MPRPSPSSPLPGRLYAALLALATLFAAFILPFLFPPVTPVYSAAYTAGANNKLATIALALLACLTLGYTYRRSAAPRSTPDLAPEPRLSPTWIVAAALLTALFTAVLSTLAVHAHLRYGEAAYFLERLRDLLAFHPALYTSLEFPYGPLLLLPAAWLTHLGLSPDAAFYTFLSALDTAGVLLTAYVLDRLPIPLAARRTLFALTVFVQLNPLLAANYSLAKFILPFAALVAGTRRRKLTRQIAALALGHLLTILVSPELGIGLAAAIVAWSIVTARRTRSALPLAGLFAPVFGYGIFLALYGRGFLDRLGNASAGALNLLLEPLPHLYVLLFALVWLAPCAVALYRRTPAFPLLFATFVLSLGLLPGALGRADPLHVFFNAWGFLLLSVVGLHRLPSFRARLWLAALALFALQVQATNFRMYARPLAQLLHPPPSQSHLDPATLRTLTGGEPIATPALLQLPLADELALRRTNLFVYDPNAGLADLWSAHSEQEKIQRLRQSNWALLPATPTYLIQEGSPNEARLKVLLRLGYRYPQRHTPVQIGALLQHEITQNWTQVAQTPTTILLKRVH